MSPPEKQLVPCVFTTLMKERKTTFRTQKNVTEQVTMKLRGIQSCKRTAATLLKSVDKCPSGLPDKRTRGAAGGAASAPAMAGRQLDTAASRV